MQEPRDYDEYGASGPEDGTPTGEEQQFIPMASPIAGVAVGVATPGEPMLMNEITASQASINVMWGLVASLFYLIVISTVAFLSGVTEAEGDASLINLLEVIPRAGVIFAFIFVILKYRGQSLAAIGLTTKSLTAKNILLGGVSAAAAYAALLLTVGLMYLFWQNGFEGLQKNPENIREMIPNVSTASLIMLMLVVAVGEELMFRGFLLVHFRRITRNWLAAVVISSIMFALPHAMQQEVSACVPLFFAGAVWAAFTIWRKSLIPAIIGHTLFNTGQMFLLYAYDSRMSQ